jgi:hypothetical protein
MKLSDLEHNEKIISLEIQELEEEIIILLQTMLTKKTILRLDKYREQIFIYSHQLQQTKKQIKKWKI